MNTRLPKLLPLKDNLTMGADNTSNNLGFADFRIILTKDINIVLFITRTGQIKSPPFKTLLPEPDLEHLLSILHSLPLGGTATLKARFKYANREFLWHETFLSHNELGYEVLGKNIDRLARAEMFYESLESISEIGSWEVDLVTESLIWSPTTYLIHDLSPDEHKPHLSEGLSFFKDQSFDIMTEAVRRMITEGTSYDVVVTLISAKKREKIVRAIGRAEFANGKVVRCYGTIQDVTEETRLRKEKQVGNERFRAVSDHAPLMLSFFDDKGQFEWVNGEWTKVLGWDLKEMQGKDMLKEFYPNPLEYSKVMAFMASGAKSWMKFQTRTKSGEVRYTQWTNVILSNGKGVGIGQDIDAQVKADLEIESTRKEFQQVFDLVQDPLVIINGNGLFTKVNPATISILEYTEAELLFTHMTDYIHPDDLENTEAIMKRFDSKNTTAKFENRYRRKDGAYRIFSWNAFASPETKQIFAAIRDITEERAHQLTLMNSANLASLGEMASGIAHEINNPLAIIKGKIDIIKKRASSPDRDDEKIMIDLGKIDSTVDRISRIIQGLRKLARGDHEEAPTTVPLKSLVEDILIISKERFMANKIDLKFEMSEELSVVCRPIQLEQVLINLLNNALDATLELPDADRWVAVRAYRFNDARIQIAVTDGGKGIPKHMTDKIMQPFFTTKPTGKGTGLGLSISKNLIESQGGLFQLNKSSPNTEFLITLPSA